MLNHLWRLYARYDKLREPGRFVFFMFFVCLPYAMAAGAVNAGWYNLFLVFAIYSVSILCTRMYWVRAVGKKGRSQ